MASASIATLPCVASGMTLFMAQPTVSHITFNGTFVRRFNIVRLTLQSLYFAHFSAFALSISLWYVRFECFASHSSFILAQNMNGLFGSTASEKNCLKERLTLMAQSLDQVEKMYIELQDESCETSFRMLFSAPEYVTCLRFRRIARSHRSW